MRGGSNGHADELRRTDLPLGRWTPPPGATISVG